MNEESKYTVGQLLWVNANLTYSKDEPMQVAMVYHKLTTFPPCYDDWETRTWIKDGTPLTVLEIKTLSDWVCCRVLYKSPKGNMETAWIHAGRTATCPTGGLGDGQ